MPSENAAVTRMVRSQIARRYVDSSFLDIRVIHGTVYLRGVLGVLRTHSTIDLNKEMEHITTILRSKPGVREVIWDVTQRT